MTGNLALGLPFVDSAVEREIRAGLAAVESMLRDAVKGDYPFVTETSRHLVDAGGSGSARCWCCWPRRPVTGPTTTR